MPSTRPRTLAEQAAAELQEAIISGALAPGTPLRLEKLARTLDMSPMPVREAGRQLEPLAVRHAAARFEDSDAERCGRLLAEHVRAYRSGDRRRGRDLHAQF